jgi:hypothetical protein
MREVSWIAKDVFFFKESCSRELIVFNNSYNGECYWRVLIILLQYVMLYSEVLHFVSCVDHCLVEMVAVYLCSSTRLSIFFLFFDIFIGYMMIVCPLEIVDSTSRLLEWSEGYNTGCSCPQTFALYCPYKKYPDCGALQDTSSRCKISLTCLSLVVIYLLCIK